MAGMEENGKKKDSPSSVDLLVQELDNILKDAKPPTTASTPEAGEAIDKAEALAGEILGEERFVGDESICPSCGAMTSIYVSRCESCGAVFDASVCRCGYCGKEVPPEALFCPGCTKPLSESEALCPVCSAAVPYRAQRCDACGAELTENEMRCASCGSTLEPNAVSCPSCATILIEGAKPREMVAGVMGGYGSGGGGGGGGMGPTMINATIQGGKSSEAIQATIVGNNDSVTEVDVESKIENKIENKLTVEAILRQPEPEKKGKGKGSAVSRARDRKQESIFPFSAIIGQEKMKRALILNVIDPLIGGVLITGQKGTGKSVAVRGMTEITPEIKIIDGCRFSCDPDRPGEWCWECQDKYEGVTPNLVPTRIRPLKVADLPLNATEDRVVGTLDVGKVLTEGVFSFESGVLAEANRGILYVDEINLLDDYVVDVLLDSAAMGTVTVEREGVSVRYPARFVIVGSMNPEEGGLRPQLLDRIALQVTVTGLEEMSARMEVVQRRMDFEKDPIVFRTRFEAEQQKVREKIKAARELRPKVQIPTKLFAAIPKVTTAFGVDGHRADIMIERGAKAMAAYEGRDTVTSDDLFRIADMVLPHRMRRKPFEQAEFSSERLRRAISDNL
jgi:magnesium chelatase subunit I